MGIAFSSSKDSIWDCADCYETRRARRRENMLVSLQRHSKSQQRASANVEGINQEALEMLLQGIDNEEKIKVHIGVSLHDLKESLEGKFIFCNIEFVSTDKDEQKLLGATEWVKYSHYIDTCFS
jgi:hypothetical protein